MALYFALITSGISLVAYELSFARSDLTGGAAGISTAGPLSEGGIARPFDLGIVPLEEPEAYLRFGLVAPRLAVVALTVVGRRRGGASCQSVGADDARAAPIAIKDPRRQP